MMCEFILIRGLPGPSLLERSGGLMRGNGERLLNQKPAII